MWYRTSSQGRVIDRIENIEAILNDAIEKSVYSSITGFKRINFNKLNILLRPALKKYIRLIQPDPNSGYLGGFDVANKILLLPPVYHPTVMQTIVHEVVHAIHMEDLKKLSFQSQEWLDNLKPEHLKNSYEEYYISEFNKFKFNLATKNKVVNKDLNEFFSKSQIKGFNEGIIAFFDSQEGSKYKGLLNDFKIINEDQWNLAKKLSSRVNSHSDLYYATNEELIAYFENAVNYFSVNYLKKVYDKFFNDPDVFLKYLREVFGTISIYKEENTNIKRFKGLTPELKKLMDMIAEATGDEHKGALEEVIDPKWWSQLAKQITNNFSQLENQIKTEF